MLCKKCMVVMESGTRYEKKKGKNGEILVHSRFCQCPKCKNRVYSNTTNFKEIMARISSK